MKNGVKGLWGRLMDPTRDFREKLFILLTLIAASTIFLAFLGDIFTGENLVEVITLGAVLLFSPMITVYTVRHKRTDLGAAIIAYEIILVVLPVAFFFGGGLAGGGILWVAFSYLYLGMLLRGYVRRIAFHLLSVITLVMYAVAYRYPELIYQHDRKMWFADSLISILLVGVTVYLMVWFQNRLFQEENTRTLEQAREIEELNRAQNRFFSSMSHEIRTPINTIIGFNEMILREEISDEVAEDAKNIQSSSRILLSLINDILDMSKMQSGKMDIVQAPYDTKKMLSDIVNMIYARAREKRLDFTVDVDPSMPTELFSDEVRLKQILINLLNNAVKYTQEGSVSLSVHCRRTSPGMALVTYSVEDTGMGIRKESIPHLFDAFRREDLEKNKYIEGTGLGLSIVKQLVDLLHGEISVNSVYTKGSTFIVAIEQEIADERMIGKFSLEKLSSGVRSEYRQSFEAPEASVLIVDDNSANLLMATKLLKATKVKIYTADSGEECLSLTAQKHFDAILMDHMMPRMDGVECMHRVREQNAGLCKDTPIIALTANAGSEIQAMYRREGFDGYLLKPVDSASLEEMLLSVLPGELVRARAGRVTGIGRDDVVREMRRKIPVMITTDSIADLPRSLVQKWKIPIMPYQLVVNGAVFDDGVEAAGDLGISFSELLTQDIQSRAPEALDYERFFAEQFSRAQHVIHITAGRHIGNGYANACEAALSFYNVKVFDSGKISAGMGLLVLYARELADAGVPDADSIIEKLEERREKLSTVFLSESTEYLLRAKRIWGWYERLSVALHLHPVLELRNSSMGVARLIPGRMDRARENYIKSMLKDPEGIDTSVLMIIYAGMKRAEMEEIRDYVISLLKFDEVYLKKASAAVAINCGPESFGLIFARK